MLLPNPTDDDLVRGVQAGDPAAADALVRRYRAPLVRYAGRLIGHRALDPEDLVQEGLLRALRHLARSQEHIELRPWLHRIVRNACFDALRAAKAAPVGLGDADVVALAGDPYATVTCREAVREALADLAALPDRQRRALEHRAFGGASHAETARALHVSSLASKMLVHRGRATLARHRCARAAVAA